MRQDMAQRDRLGKGFLDLETLEVRVDVGVEVKVASLDLLHYRYPGKQFRNRTGTEQGLCRIDRDLVLDVLEAVTLGKDDFAIERDGDYTGRAVVVRHERRHDAVDECLEGGRVPKVGCKSVGGQEESSGGGKNVLNWFAHDLGFPM